ADLTAKENTLKDKQAATKQAQNTLDSSKEELKGHKGINLPANFIRISILRIIPSKFNILTRHF
ncbi:hypothetical protein Q604_UNBC12671G0001, partial [human gut metagenome]